MGAGLWPWHQVRTQLPQPKPTPSPSRQPGDHPEESMAAMVSHVDASQAVASFPAETCPLLCQGEWRSPLPPAPLGCKVQRAWFSRLWMEWNSPINLLKLIINSVC